MNKTPVVFVPGTLCTSVMFESQLTYFNQPDTGFDASAVDFSHEDDLAKMADTVTKAVSSTPFFIVGFSMGGFVALELLRQKPELIKGIILLNSNAHADLPGRQELRAGHLQQAKENGLRSTIESLYLPNYLAHENASHSKLILDMAENCGLETFENQLQVLAKRPDASDTITVATCPILAIGGEKDNLCPVSEQQRIAGLNANVQLQIIENAGHFSSLEQADEVNSLISSWLMKVADNEL